VESQGLPDLPWERNAFPGSADLGKRGLPSLGGERVWEVKMRWYCRLITGELLYGRGRVHAHEHFLVFFDLADLRSAREALENHHPDPVLVFRRVLGGIVRLGRKQAEALRAKHPEGAWLGDEAHRAYGPVEPVVVHSIMYRLDSPGALDDLDLVLICVSTLGNFQVPICPGTITE
jgi:hypothetical protein